VGINLHVIYGSAIAEAGEQLRGDLLWLKSNSINRPRTMVLTFVF
jgi:hypothetical protein